MKETCIIFLLILSSCQIISQNSTDDIPFSKYYHVDPHGDDSNSGSLDSPYRTISYGISRLHPGESLYLHKGVYEVKSTLNSNIDGTELKFIGIQAYHNDEVIIDFSRDDEVEMNGFNLKHDYWYIRGVAFINATQNGVKITGDYNIIENCSTYDNGDTGLQISSPASYNYILNCDSYRNYDPENHGQDADGFGVKFDIGQGNRFYGCRAWNNSDDGWDFWESTETIVVENCWAFENGINLWDDDLFEGNGNGFKLGGSNKAEPLHYNLANHTLIRSISFNNENKGFDQNNNLGIQTLINNTAWGNKNRNYGFWRAALYGNNIFTNNISFNGTLSLVQPLEETNNSWQGYTVTEDDFLSLDSKLGSASRGLDGKLPINDLGRLSRNSSLINGDGPDLGAF